MSRLKGQDQVKFVQLRNFITSPSAHLSEAHFSKNVSLSNLYYLTLPPSRFFNKLLPFRYVSSFAFEVINRPDVRCRNNLPNVELDEHNYFINQVQVPKVQ